MQKKAGLANGTQPAQQQRQRQQHHARSHTQSHRQKPAQCRLPQSQSNTHILDNPVHEAEHSWQYLYLRNAYARTVEGQVGKLPHRRNYRQHKGYLGRPGQMRQE